MEMHFTTTALIAFMVLFFGVAIVVFIKTLLEIHRREAKGRRTQGMRELIRQRVGPVTPERAPLNAPLRVGVEFVCSLFGLTGLGWSLSTRMAPGIVMMLAGPIFCWMLWPMILHYSGILAANPYSIIMELPVVAALSAGTLAVLEARKAGGGRRREHAAG